MREFGGWDSVLEAVRDRIGVPAYDAWFRGLRGERQGDTLVVRCPDRFSRDWIRSRYGSVVADVAAGCAAIEFRVDPAAERRGEPDLQARDPLEKAIAAVAKSTPRSAEASRPVRAETSFESFVQGPGNALALEASRAIARRQGGQCSPLVISARSGLGKTHLCRAIQAALRDAGCEGVVYRSSEEFTTDVTQAIRSGQMPQVRHRYRRAANVLILEDVQFFQGKKATQIELFHTLDHLIQKGRSVVLTSDRAPHELDGLDPTLRSRITAGLVARIGPPELETRERILRERAAGGGVRIPEDCLALLAERSVTSVRDLLAGLNQVVARASLLRRPVTVDLIQETLATLPVPGPVRDLDEILDRTARTYGVTRDELRSRSRRRRLVRPRHFAMYLCRRYTDASLVEIGRALARDHTTVMHAIESVERKITEQPQLRYELEAVAAQLQG